MIRFASVAAAIPLVLAGSLAMAQGYGQGGSIVGNGFSPPVQPHDTPGPAKLPPPPAIPGSASAAPAAPTDKLPTDLPPNEALFDAINRGDLAAARDALARGADVHAENVLGLTPTELSVDLGRHDITFLLLSQRGGDSASGPPPGASAALGKAGKPGKEPGRSAAAALEASVTARRPLRQPPTERPAPAVRYANTDPGTPVPQAGFLGFGGSAVR